VLPPELIASNPDATRFVIEAMGERGVRFHDTTAASPKPEA
jgi:hypothetical protein